MTFGTTINCMDGRVQPQVHDYIKTHYNVTYVDTITSAGPSKLLAQNIDVNTINNIHERTDISIYQHGSTVIAICGHTDCAGIKDDDETQKVFIQEACRRYRELYPQCIVIGLWLNQKFTVEKIDG